MCAAIGIVRQKMRDAEDSDTLFGRREKVNQSERKFVGVMLWGEAKREAGGTIEISTAKSPPWTPCQPSLRKQISGPASRVLNQSSRGARILEHQITRARILMMRWGEVQREAPVRTEPHPTRRSWFLV